MPSTRTRGVLGVPERYRAAFSTIAKMNDVAFDELTSAFVRAPKFANIKELSAWIAPEAKGTSAADVAQIVDALTSLYRVRLRLEAPAERIARDIATSLQEEGDVSEESRVRVAERISKLLAIDSLNVIQTKAQELKGEYEHEFCDVRIFTDLRPVFGGNVADAPEAMLLVHMLRLGYHDAHENKHREFYVSLDSKDLASLKQAIERAETKASSIKSRLDSAGLNTTEA